MFEVPSRPVRPCMLKVGDVEEEDFEEIPPEEQDSGAARAPAPSLAGPQTPRCRMSSPSWRLGSARRESTELRKKMIPRLRESRLLLILATRVLM